MISKEDILHALEEVPDPEMPISIVDLGLVEAIELHRQNGATDVSIELLPTFVGCPALDMIQGDVEAKVGALQGVGKVCVHFSYDPPWSVDRISEQGRQSLREHGVTVPERGTRLPVPGHEGTVELRTSAVPCPFCGSSSTYLDSAFGPTRCRMIYYCKACKNSFEHMKKV